MEKIDALACIRTIVAEIFERDPDTLGPETRLMQDLPCESIDLLEIAARVSQRAGREVDDEALFLRNLRALVAERPGDDPAAVIAANFPWLAPSRVESAVADMRSPAPFVTLADMAAYLDYLQGC
ncbi:MAG: phosphopantetheine-binding protein [Desulfovibrionaceae bacterium]|nr:phosphopantetheine-binding protein [Desulfovibrionaceae bacterium]